MQTNNSSDARMMRGTEIAQTKTITETESGFFLCPSQTRADVSYEVRIIGETWTCTCLDFQTRADQIEACKHILATKLTIAARVELQEKPKPKVFADDAIQCEKCGSIKVIRFGTRGEKQTFRCNDCGARFTPSLIKRSRYSPETITLTLDLYFSGMSYAKIARSLNDNFGMNLGGASIYRWVNRFVPQITEYVNSLCPQLSETWHTDEVFQSMKGGIKYKGNKSMAFLWNVLDRKTRFLIASKLSERRDAQGAIAAFKEAIKNAHGSEPERVRTDSLKVYVEGIETAFGEKKPIHEAKMGIGKPHANNNRIERMNGTQRERFKVQRGWKSMKTAIPDGQRIQYNFVKPHMALEGQTPAQTAGISPEQKATWMELLRKALDKR